MQHPFQCIATLQQRCFVAACGPNLTSVDLETGEIMCKWMPEQAIPDSTEQSNGKTEDQEQPPAKKQKTAAPATASAKAPSIIKLTVSTDEDYLVAITEDKCVHVFEHKQGQLLELSQRIMPKRPCAVQILPDNTTILVADKFGDVYSIPLIPTTADSGDAGAGAGNATPQPEPHFKPSADFTTIHSKRNRQALEAQMKQKNFTKKKDPLKFEHKIVIGHVSMLTDMRYLREANSPQRGHIVTADRDEHIRVSRGLPQAYITEGYCLGHTEFVSKICQVGDTQLLISGGGDDWLGVWDWTTRKLFRKVNIKSLMPSPSGKTAVSGIWSIDVERKTLPLVVVAVEGVKSLLFLALSRKSDSVVIRQCYTAELEHCPIDIASIRESSETKMVVSLDNRGNGDRLTHFSLKPELLNEIEPELVESKSVATGVDACDCAIHRKLGGLQQQHQVEADPKELDTLLYGISNLRKRRDAADGDVEGDGEESILEPEAADA